MYIVTEITRWRHIRKITSIMKKSITLLLFLIVSTFANAQEFDKVLYEAFDADDVEFLSASISDANECLDVKGTGYSPLALAIKFNAQKYFNHLLKDQSIDLDKSCGGKSALQYTAKYGKLDMLKELLKAGADPKSQYKGRTALDYAKKYKQQEVVDFLNKM